MTVLCMEDCGAKTNAITIPVRQYEFGKKIDNIASYNAPLRKFDRERNKF